ncbi:MAG TPA: class I SAM-dependent methyltransferase [Gemmatimonadota bacterium]|nr:class I SAM-dependent methyltransferase [Gemmatimonadota bacterium]
MRRPSREDVSRPRREGYAYKKEFYQSREVAEDYDFHRLGSPALQRRNRRKWTAVRAALTDAEGIRTVLDLPCGTGRFTGSLAGEGYRVVGGDISFEMMRKALDAPDGRREGVLGYVQADAERLPFPDGAVDCVMSIRFLFHVDPGTRVRILSEMRRVSRRWLVLDYRHRYTWRWVKWTTLRRLGLSRREMPRVSRAELRGELAAAGLAVRRVVRVGTPLFSDKWIVLGEPSGA